MEHYLINSAACLAILLLFYKLFLEKEQMHHIKRGYLLIAVIASISIPLITMTTYVDTQAFLFLTENTNSAEVSEKILASKINWNLILWTVYGIGVLFFSIRFFFNLHSMVLRIRKNPKLKNNQFVTVLLRSDITPHTFFRYLFFNKHAYEKHLIPSEVLMHEQTHAKELHSLDILLIELLQVVFWFNPLLYLAKNAIKLNHEFLADKAVIQTGIETTTYQKTLLAFSSNAEASNLANAFNYSSIKKRFTVMKTQTSKKMILVKTILVIPILALLLYSFSSKKEVSMLANLNTTDVISEPKVSVLVQDIATEKMVKEYNKIAKKYNTSPKNERTIGREELGRMVYIYDRMNKEQRDSSEKFPEIIIPKNAPAPPMPTMENDLGGIVPPPPPPPTSEHDRAGAPHPAADMIAPPPPPIPAVHMKELSERGAIFYFEGKQITGKEAIGIAKKIKAINVQVKDHDSKKPIVTLSKDPIVVE